MTLSEILKDSNYKLTQFSTESIKQLEENIIIKEKKGNYTPYINCLVRRKEIKLTPEEAVRQLYLMVLHDDYGYSYERMEVEYTVTFGREKKRADIVIFNNQDDFKRIRNGKVTRWFYNSSNWSQVEDVLNANGSNEYEVFNFCDVIAHEIGHLYGLSHFDKFCTTEGNVGIMHSELKPNKPKKGLSNDDKCAFMKLYCNNLTPVEEVQNINEKIRNYPNPTSNIINIEFGIETLNKKVIINIYDIFGNYLGEFYNKQLNKSTNETQIDISSLLKGVYFYKVLIGNKTLINKFIKSK